MHAVHPVLFHFNGIGDNLLALPAIRALSSLAPQRLVLVGGRRSSDAMFFGDLPLREIREVRFSWTPDRVGKQFDLEESVRAIGPCDLLLSLNTWHNEHADRLLERFADVESIGFFRPFRRCLETTAEQHACERYFLAARLFAPHLELADFCAPPDLPAEVMDLARRIRLLLPGRSRLLVVHTETQTEKVWPRERFGRLLDAFLDRQPDYTALIVDWQPPGIVSRHLGRRLHAVPGLPLEVALALVAQSDLFLGVDSCMLHLADFFRVPGVGLFGPTDPRRFGFLFSPHRHLRADGPIDRIEVDEVLESLESLLA